MSKLYKFMGENIADVLMIDDGFCGIKFSYLEDYNDPYEYFLTIDYNQSPEILAFYNEMINMVIKTPATCFAKSPNITPMWAHYSNNSEGFVIEIDEEKLDHYFKKLDFGYTFGDIDYRDAPQEGMQGSLLRAYQICKPRHIHWLQTAISSAAYFTKKLCWSYEQERRMLISEEHLQKVSDNLMILKIPVSAVTGIICGAKAKPELKEKVASLSKKLGCKQFKMVIGRSQSEPYFLDKKKAPYIFNGSKMIEKRSFCKVCREPTPAKIQKCSWCSITKNHEVNAAHRNSFRMLNEAGILEDYIAKVNKIDAAYRNRKP